jgi:hypothetical protein
VRALVFLLAIAMACKWSSPTVGNSDGATSGGEPTMVTPDVMPPIDAPFGACDPVLCATAMGSCNPNGHCEIHHGANGGVVCPPGLFCDIYCNAANDSCQMSAVDCTAGIGCNIYCGHGVAGDNACADAQVKCSLTGPCAVHCVGENACRNHGVLCGTGPCTVDCIGNNACEDNGVQCGNASSCAANCNGNNACHNENCLGTPGSCTFNCCGNMACGSTCGCPETTNGC